MKRQSENPGSYGDELGRHADDLGMAADSILDGAGQAVEGRPVGSDGVDDGRSSRRPSLRAQPRQVIDVDRADAVLAGAAHGEHRETAQKPRDVIDENTVAAEQDRGSQNGMRDARLGQCLLYLRLTAEIWVTGRDARMRDRDVDDPLNPCFPGRVEKYPRVGDGSGMVDPPPRETDPIGVIKRLRSLQRFGQPGGIIEVQVPDLNRRVPRGAAGMAGQRADPSARGPKFPGRRRSRVAERPGDNVEPGRSGQVRHAITPVSYAGHGPALTR